WHLDGGLRTAGDRRRVIDDPFDDELAGERGDGQIEALDAQARDTDNGADDSRHEPACGKSDPEGKVQLDRKVGCRVGADRHESGVADRDLTGVADQDVETQSADDGDENEIENR